jgi:hypothetical protein
MKRIVTLLLCALLITLPAACGQADRGSNADTPAPSDTAEVTGTPEVTPLALNFEGAYKIYEPKTVILTVNGESVYWDEFFYYIYAIVNDISQTDRAITDWSAEYLDGMTYGEYVISTATNMAIENKALDYGAKSLGVTLTDEERSSIQADWNSRVESAGGEEAFLKQLEENFVTKEMFDRFMEFSYLEEDCYKAIYGEQGEKLTNEEVAEYTAEDGYMMVKHILLMAATQDETGAFVPFEEEEKAKVYTRAQELLNQLNTYDGDDFDTYFDQLMVDNSEDPGVASYPDGYLFQSGQMYKEFEEASLALEIGGLSGIIESQAGYHIIYRIPVNYDIAPIAYSEYGYSLRYISSRYMYYSIKDGWMNSLVVTNSDELKGLDLVKLFAEG